MHLTRAVLISALALAAAAAPNTAAAGRTTAVLDAAPVKDLPLVGEELPRVAARPAPAPSAAGVTPPVGTVRQWLGRDDANDTLYRKDYVLRGVGGKVEVWVAQDTSFPAGDCRNAVPAGTTVTDAQVAGLVAEYDDSIAPVMAQAFSTAPDRDGTNALLGPDRDGNGGDYTGAGDALVVLVDNVRDDDYYTFPAVQSYVPGFFSVQFDELFDRNVLTLDAFDWRHRTGDAPPDDPTADPCTSRPAQPRGVERQLTRDLQQLLLSYTDPVEVPWVREGLSDLAVSLVGYANTQLTVAQEGFERPLVCFNGSGPGGAAGCGGPQDSLTLFRDARDRPADRGNAWSFMLYVYDHFGTEVVSRIHRDGERQGLAGVQAALGGPDVLDVLHDVQTMNLVDRLVGGPSGGTVTGRPLAAVTTDSLNAAIDVRNPLAYAEKGVTPNGADYVLLRRADGSVLPGRALTSARFSASPALRPQPLAWRLVDDDPDRPGNSVLFSGNASSLDVAMVTRVGVPSADPVLRFLDKRGTEAGYDYAYVSVSTDGGETYLPLMNGRTVPGPLGPALNGTTTGFEQQAFDLSAYAGQEVLLSFRYVSDDGVNEGGWLVDDVSVGALAVSDGSTLAPFDSPTEVRPVPVTEVHVRLVGLDPARRRVLVQAYDSAFSLGGASLRAFTGYPQVVAIVSYGEPTEQYAQRASYRLRVNDVLQRGS